MRRFWKKDNAAGLPFFVSVGAGLNQIPLIREAKKLGFHVIGVDTNPNAQGFLKCDLKIQESILNHNEIYMKLQELLVDGVIRGVMTKSFGPAIETTAFLAEKFGIPFLPFEACGAFTDKSLMKKIFLEHGIPTSRVIDSGSRSRKEKYTAADLPLVFKPNTGHAKKGVMLMNTAAEINAHIKEAVRSGNPYIIEEYVRGDEIIALGIVNKGEYHLVDVTDKKTTPPPYFVDLKHVAPSVHEDLSARIQHIGQKVAAAFAIHTSPLVMEFIVTGSKELCLIEAVPEFGGEFLVDVLIPGRTGYNFIAEAIKACTGTGFRPPSLRKKRKAAVVQYITDGKGTLASCNPDGPSKKPGTVFSRIFKEIGADVQEPRNNHDRIGVVAVAGKTVEEALDRAEKAAESFNIRIKQ
ncbi:MAG TPA: ATP-grasp domain-containing protein [Spirochaetota bacterium]|nr:ATP-grasp domain-containing protein [Spirochaetota bacterium]HSA13192.1 ATP-grasp domain-containing protein [Spirochaetota bacterium]